MNESLVNLYNSLDDVNKRISQLEEYKAWLVQEIEKEKGLKETSESIQQSYEQ